MPEHHRSTERTTPADSTPVPAKATSDEISVKSGGVTIPFKALVPYALALLVGGSGGNLMGQLTGTTQLREEVAKLNTKIDTLTKDVADLKAAQLAEEKYYRTRNRYSEVPLRDWDGDPTRDSLTASRRDAGSSSTVPR